MRVVMYAEGGRELLGLETVRLAPGDRIVDDALGPGHVLLRRCLEKTRNIPEGAVQFEEPLRTRRGQLPRGGDLSDARTLRQLLTWADPKKRPDIAVVFVDCDEISDRRRLLKSAIEGIAGNNVIGVAVQEFEAWMIADGTAVRDACSTSFDAPGDIERLPCREAKQRLDRALSAGDASDIIQRSRRIAIGRTCDLDRVKTRCPSFNEFLVDLSVP